MGLVFPPFGTPQLVTVGGLRRLYQPKMVVWGDSFAANCSKDQGTTYTGSELDHQFFSQGILHWARMASQGALSASMGLHDNYGVGNTTTSDHIASQLASVIAAKPQISVWHGGTNDVSSGNADGVVIPIATTKANVLTAIVAHQNIGALLVIFTIPARGNYSYGQRQACLAINEFYKTLPYLYPNVVLVDYAMYWVDHTNTNGDPQGGDTGSVTGLSYDGTHPTALGAYLAGNIMWNALAPYVAARWPCETAGVVNVYDATNNPTGNLIANASEMLGTGGTYGSDTTVTGTIASNWVVRNYANGLPVTCSKGTGTQKYGGTQWTTQRLVIGQSGTGVKIVYANADVAMGTSGVSIGDTLNAACWLRVNNSTGLYGASLGLYERGSSGYVQANNDMWPCVVSSTYYQWPSLSAAEMIQEPPPVTLSSNMTSGARLMWSFFVNAATSAVDVEFGLPKMRKA